MLPGLDAPPTRTLSDAERLDWLRLIRTENVGPVTFHKLLERFGTAARALDALPELSRRGGRTTALRPLPRADAERELERARRIGARLVALVEPEYPRALAVVEDAPPLITVLGHAHLLNRDAVGIVGARNASLNGRRLAETLAADLGRAGYLVVSGLARGIDAAAHAGSLATGTVAVVAGGADVVYPEENKDLYDRVVESGALIAESPVGTQPLARHFPRRNRLISGMSLGVVVVEAALRSGSLITARMALDQGREVFAVPGSPLDPRCQGTNDLIRQGATLTEAASDVTSVLDPIRRRPLGERPRDLFSAAAAQVDETQLDRARRLVMEALSPSPTPVDALLRELGLPVAVILTALLELELAGRIVRHPGNQVAWA